MKIGWHFLYLTDNLVFYSVHLANRLSALYLNTKERFYWHFQPNKYSSRLYLFNFTYRQGK